MNWRMRIGLLLILAVGCGPQTITIRDSVERKAAFEQELKAAQFAGKRWGVHVNEGATQCTLLNGEWICTVSIRFDVYCNADGCRPGYGAPVGGKP